MALQESVSPFLQTRLNFWYLKITKILGDPEASQIVPNDILFSVWIVHCIHAVLCIFYVSDTICAINIFLVDSAQTLTLQMLGVRMVKEGLHTACHVHFALGHSTHYPEVDRVGEEDSVLMFSPVTTLAVDILCSLVAH